MSKKLPAQSVRDRDSRIRDRDRLALEAIRKSGREFNAENLAQDLVMLMDEETRQGREEQPLFEHECPVACTTE